MPAIWSQSPDLTRWGPCRTRHETQYYALTTEKALSGVTLFLLKSSYFRAPWKTRISLIAAAAAISLAGCATTDPQSLAQNDPFEPTNREIFAFDHRGR